MASPSRATPRQIALRFQGLAQFNEQIALLSAQHRRQSVAPAFMTPSMIDAGDGRFRAWLGTLPPRQELVVRMALKARAKNLGPDWTAASRC